MSFLIIRPLRLRQTLFVGFCFSYPRPTFTLLQYGYSVSPPNVKVEFFLFSHHLAVRHLRESYQERIFPGLFFFGLLHSPTNFPGDRYDLFSFLEPVSSARKVVNLFKVQLSGFFFDSTPFFSSLFVSVGSLMHVFLDRVS